MYIAYFKRFRMEIDLDELPPLEPLPEGHAWLGWQDSLIDLHADVKFQSFQDEIDSVVFPSLASRQGCVYLMREISRKAGFLPLATWLLEGPDGLCGTVQGIRDGSGLGAIQNLGVLPLYRGRGLGKALLIKALHGFKRSGIAQAYLEVTAQNDGAVRLYRKLGFRFRKTLYKAVEAHEADLLQPVGEEYSI